MGETDSSWLNTLLQSSSQITSSLRPLVSCVSTTLRHGSRRTLERRLRSLSSSIWDVCSRLPSSSSCVIACTKCRAHTVFWSCYGCPSVRWAVVAAQGQTVTCANPRCPYRKWFREYDCFLDACQF